MNLLEKAKFYPTSFFFLIGPWLLQKEKDQTEQNDKLPKIITTSIIQGEPGPGPPCLCLTSVTFPWETFGNAWS